MQSTNYFVTTQRNAASKIDLVAYQLGNACRPHGSECSEQYFEQHHASCSNRDGPH